MAGPRILLTGRDGQVGRELQHRLGALGEVIATGRDELDLAASGSLAARVREIEPSIIVNAAAYTAVDRAESEPELAHAINAAAPAALAGAAAQSGALLVHYSTDYVFDGDKDGPYVEDDAPHPVSVYGATKLEGERAIRASGCRHLILRTSWVYAGRGHNFMLTMLRLAAERDELRVVADQHGSPTDAGDLARATLGMLAGAIAGGPQGTYHVTGSGTTTWHGFAQEILAQSAGRRASPVRLVAITTAEYPTPARRPRNAVLSCGKLLKDYGLALPDWRDTLRSVLAPRRT